MHVAHAQNPGSRPADRGIEEIEPDTGARQKIGKDQLLRHGQQIVVQQHDVIAVPPHRSADMQQHVIHRQGHRAQLVGHAFGRVEMPHVKAERRSATNGIAHVELVAADGHGLNPDTEQLRFHRIDDLGLWQIPGQHGIERGFEPAPRSHTVNRDVLRSVRHPDVVHRRTAKLGPHAGCDLATAATMLDPEGTDARIGVRERQVVVGLGMGKEGRVEIKSQPLFLRPVNPRGKVTVLDGVTVGRLIGIKVEGVQVQTVLAGDQAIGELKIRAQLGGIARATGVVARRLNAAPRGACLAFKPADIIALPAMHRDRDGQQRLDRGLGIDAPIGKGSARGIIGHARHPYRVNA